MYPNSPCPNCPDCPTPVTPVPIPDLHNVCWDHYNASCVEYTGANIECLGITPGMLLPEILNIFSIQCGKCCVIPPVNCVLSDWGPWSTCTTTVGAGSVATAVQTRTRTVITPAANDGTPCGPLTDTRTTVFQPVCFTFGSSLCGTAPNGTQVLTPAVCFYNDKPYYNITVCSNTYVVWFNNTNNLWYLTSTLGVGDATSPVLNNNGNYYPISNSTTQVWQNRNIRSSIDIIKSTVTTCGDYKTCFKLQVIKNGRIYVFYNGVSPSYVSAGQNNHLFYQYTYTIDSVNYNVTVVYNSTTSTWTAGAEYFGSISTVSLGTLNDSGIYPEGNWTPDPLSTQPDIHMIMSTTTNTCVQPTPVDCVSTFPNYSTTVTAASAASGTITYTASNSFAVGQPISITGLSTTAFNLTNVLIASANTTTFTVINSATGAAVSGASATAAIPCISGIQTRYPKITTQPSNNGTPCPGPRTQVCATPNCLPVPAAGLALSVVGTSIVISFTPVTGASTYSVFYSINGVLQPTVTGASSPITLVPILTCATTYTAYIKTNCGLISSDQTPTAQLPPLTLTTPACVDPTPPVCGTPFLSGFVNSGLTSTSVLPKIDGNGFYNSASPNSGVTLSNTGGATGGAGLILSNALLSTGFLIGGRFTLVNGISRIGIAKLKCDNTIDYTFSYTTGVTTYSQIPNTSPGEIYAIAVDNNLGRIYIGGNFSSYNGQPRNNFAALDMNGNLLSSTVFNIGTGFTAGSIGTTLNAADVRDIKIQSDGKILACGLFTNYSGNTVHPYLIRLNTNGTVDSSFVIGAGFTTAVNTVTLYTIAIDSTGYIFAGGTFQKYQNIASKNLVKIKPNGDIDNLSFPVGSNIDQGIGNNTSGTVYKILIQGTRLLVGGSFTKYGTTVTSKFMKLILADATLDPLYTKNTDTYTSDTSRIIYDIVMSTNLTPAILIAGDLPSYLGNSTLKNYYVLDSVTGIINTTYSVTTPNSDIISKIILK